MNSLTRIFHDGFIPVAGKGNNTFVLPPGKSGVVLPLKVTNMCSYTHDLESPQFAVAQIAELL